MVVVIFLLVFLVSGSSGLWIVVCFRMFWVIRVCFSVIVFFMCELWW